MALTYTDTGKKILHSWGRFRVTLLEAVVTGDLLSFYNTDNDYTVQFADESDEQRADCIACIPGDAGDEIWAALKAVIKPGVTYGAQGIPTQINFAEATDFFGAPLYLGEAGKVEDTTGTTYRQVVGRLLSRDRIMLDLNENQMGSDMYFASGAIIDFDSADIVMTHSAGKITVSSAWGAVAVAASRTGRPLGVELTLTGNMGNYVNALKGYVDASAGGTTGLLSAVNCEIKMPTGACAGAFYPLEIEYVDTASTSFGTPGTGSQAGFIYINATGTVTDLDSDGVFMSLNGLSPAAGKLFSADMHTLRCTIDNGTYTKYPVMSIAANILSHNIATVGAVDGHIGRFLGTSATPQYADGTGAFEVQLNISGLSGTHANAASCWINLGGSANIAGYLTLHTDGVYDGGATLTNAMISWGKYACMLSANPKQSNIFELNFAGANSALDAIFNVNSAVLALGLVTGDHDETTVYGSIPFYSIAGGAPKWIRMYDSAA